MTRITSGVVSSARHKKFLKKYAKGFKGRSKNCFRIAIERIERSWQNAYIGRKNKKRDMRSIWIQRIGAASRMHGLSYSKFMFGLKLEKIEVNRKVLADLAARHEDKFAFFAKKSFNALKLKGEDV